MGGVDCESEATYSSPLDSKMGDVSAYGGAIVSDLGFVITARLTWRLTKYALCNGAHYPIVGCFQRTWSVNETFCFVFGGGLLT